MFKKCFQLLKSRGFAVLFGIVLISACTVTAGAVVIEDSGDGLFLYGPVVCPQVPDHPSGGSGYMVYDSLTGSFDVHDFILSYVTFPDFLELDANVFSSPGNYIGSLYVYTPSDTVASTLGISTGSWLLVENEYNVSFGPVDNVVWYSAVYEDDILRISPYPPFDLTGMDYIWWDGDSSGLSVKPGISSGNDFFYKVSYSLDLPSSFIASSYCPDFPFRSNQATRVSESDDYWSVTGSQFSVTNSVFARNYYNDGFYFRHLVTSSDPSVFNRFCNFFAYVPVSSGGIDFSQTSLTVSNPEYDYQSAEFDVSWSNLPEISYPDDIQYFLRGRLSDGAASQPPEIYLGSSDDPPEATPSVSFSFTDLQPDTQYSATFELVYNDTGNFRDFISSGVSTTVSFTTLSDGSISEGDKAIINAIQQGNKDNQQWLDSNMGAAVGDLPEDTTETDSILDNLDEHESEYHADAVNKFNELSSTFHGFDGSVSSGISLASTLFSRVWNSMGDYVIVYTFPLLLGLALVIIGRVSRVHLPNSGDRIKGKDES